MSRIGTITRRSFLVASVAVAGGVAFGAYKLNEAAPNPLKPEEGFTPLNAFVVIDADGVTIVTPKAEMGQGVQSTWAAFAAEELDLAWHQVRTMHGPPAKAYYNSALFGAALPFMDYQVGPFKERLRKIAGEGAKLLSLQLTGGSTSMRDGYERVRLAGAVARETLKEAAAQRLGLSRADLTTRDGMVITPDGTQIPYSDLAVEAAAIDPPSVELRERSEWRLLGTSLPRVDLPPKATGTATYAIDVRLPGMKFATVRMNPRRTGMVSFNADAALRMDGVEKVLDLGSGIAVVARNSWLAMQAAQAVEIEWEPSLYPPTTEGIYDEIIAAFDDAPNSVIRDDGDVDSATGETVLEADYHVPVLAHATMEPMNATALFEDGALTLWCGNQAPVLSQQGAAEAAGIPVDAVTLHTTLMGGGFGRRGERDFAAYAAQVAVAIPGTPVGVVWSREEDMTHDYYRPAAMARFRGVVTGGEAVALDGKISAASVIQEQARRYGRSMNGTDRELVSGIGDQPYGLPNLRIAGHRTKSDVPVGSWRSVSASFNGFFLESFIDEMAHAAGRDPLDFRLSMTRKEHEPSAKVLEKVAEISNWTGQTPEGVGRGVAFSYTFGTPVAHVIEVRQEDRGIRIKKVWSACDPGVALDPRNIEAQVMGGCLFGLSAAVMGEITFSDGAVEQQNFPDYDALRMHNAPAFEIAVLENNTFIGGIGEPGTPPAAPALANALFDLTGRRGRRLPLIHDFDLLI